MAECDDSEWKCLETLCLYSAGIRSEDEVVSCLRERSLSLGRVYDRALRHKVQFVISSVLLEPAFVSLIPVSWWAFLRLALSSNRLRNTRLLDEAERIFLGLRAAGLPCVSRKGVILEHTVYGSRGHRWMGDIDFMVRDTDKIEIYRVLNDLGYQAGAFDNRINRIVPHDRRMMLTLAISPDHLPKFNRLEELDPLGVVTTDFATSFSWQNSAFVVDLERAFTAAGAPLLSQGVKLEGFPPAYNLLDVSLHFYRDAYFEESIRNGPDALLSNLLDIILIYRNYLETLGKGIFGRFVQTLGAEKPCAWVMGHLDDMFGTQLSKEMGLDGIASKEYLLSYRKSGGSIRTWHRGMRERMRVADRRVLFDNLRS